MCILFGVFSKVKLCLQDLLWWRVLFQFIVHPFLKENKTCKANIVFLQLSPQFPHKSCANPLVLRRLCSLCFFVFIASLLVQWQIFYVGTSLFMWVGQMWDHSTACSLWLRVPNILCRTHLHWCHWRNRNKCVVFSFSQLLIYIQCLTWTE